MEPGVELIEAVEMFGANGRGIALRDTSAGRDDGVAEGVDIELTIARATIPMRDIVKWIVSRKLTGRRTTVA